MNCQHRNSKIVGLNCDNPAKWYFIGHSVNALNNQPVTAAGIPVCGSHAFLLISGAIADDHKQLLAFTVQRIDSTNLASLDFERPAIG